MRIGVLGCAGRMGRAVIGEVLAAEGLKFFEVYNGHTLAFNSGTDRLPSMDSVWDVLLSAGRRLFGIAVDDAHHFLSWGSEFSNPGRGWVSIQTGKTRREIMASLRTGRYYASTGPSLDVALVGGDLVVRCAEDSRIDFIADGEIVKSFEAAALRVVILP